MQNFYLCSFSTFGVASYTLHFTHLSLFVDYVLCKAFWGHFVKSDKLPGVMSLEELVGAEDYNFEKWNNLEVWNQKEASLPDLSGPLPVSVWC